MLRSKSFSSRDYLLSIGLFAIFEKISLTFSPPSIVFIYMVAGCCKLVSVAINGLRSGTAPFVAVGPRLFSLLLPLLFGLFLSFDFDLVFVFSIMIVSDIFYVLSSDA